jgi:hypothetical protein
MQIRISKRTSASGETLEYAQIVESFRRASDGMPSHRVIAHLGKLSPIELDNLRAALRASREGRRVIAAPARRPNAAQVAALPTVAASLRYLDLAVSLALWKQWALGELIDDLMPGEGDVRTSAVVAALVLQRCVAPASKLFSTQWFPRTALPELLDVAPSKFNNTRIHRVLDELDRAGRALQGRLPSRYVEQEGAFVSLFLDVTDAWFVGHGPELARRGKTKEGVVKRKVGIVLLCNERGYPLRWEVVEGSAPDNKTMLAMVQSISGLKFTENIPLVCDRAMGRTATIRELARSGIRFVTALTVTEFGSYSSNIPLIEITVDESTDRQRTVQEAARAAETAGMQRVSDDLLVVDLGTCDRAPSQQREVSSTPTVDVNAIHAVRTARELKADVADGRFDSMAAAARVRGVGLGAAKKYSALNQLSEDIQRQILDGDGGQHSIAQVIRIARLPSAEAQREAYQALLLKRPHRRSPRPALVDDRGTSGNRPRDDEPLRVRVVTYFNPDRFVEQRLWAKRKLADIAAFVEELNCRLARSPAAWTVAKVAAAVDRELRASDLIEAFKLGVTERVVAGSKYLEATLTLNETVWDRRRRYDGFTVIVAHPSLTQTAVELSELYRAKDIVEKDFRTIKSAIDLRPIWHRTDGKVRAHVTICMLALLLERTLEHRLKRSAYASTTLELLEPCRLNQYKLANDEQPVYAVTQPDREQREILRELQLESLVDPDDVSARIHPR